MKTIFLILYLYQELNCTSHYTLGGRRDRDRMVVGFITTHAIGAYHH
jgi:hypothetical protein